MIIVLTRWIVCEKKAYQKIRHSPSCILLFKGNSLNKSNRVSEDGLGLSKEENE